MFEKVNKYHDLKYSNKYHEIKNNLANNIKCKKIEEGL